MRHRHARRLSSPDGPYRGWAPAFGLLLALAACGPDLPPGQEGPFNGVDQEEPGIPDATISLEPRNESGVEGQATARHGPGEVTVTLELRGLPGPGEYAAHIHGGSCETGGGVVVGLSPVQGAADGTGSSVSTVEDSAVAPETPTFIMVHGEGGTPIACGDLAGHGS